MKLYILCSFVFCSVALQANFLMNTWYEYQANKAYVASNYDQAGALYTKLLQKGPYCPDVNYNMGLVLYAQKNYAMASHYFDRAIEHATSNLHLKEQALFNQGNAYVEQKKLYEALGSYSKVLDLNSKNDRARHNLEYVKQLLQEQQQKDQQDQNDQQQDGDNDQQGDDKNQKKEQSKSKNQKNQDGSKSQSSDSDSGEQSEESDHDRDGKQPSSEQKRSDKDSKSQQGKDESSKKRADEKQEEDMADKLKKSSKGQKKDDAQSAQKDGKKEDASKDSQEKSSEMSDEASVKSEAQSLGKDLGSQSKNNDGEQGVALQDAYAGEMQQKPETDERLDKRAVMVMQKLQEQEDYMQKQLLKMNVSKSGAFGYGQKNW